MDRKNILILAPYFPPINAIGSLRPYSWAKYWSKMGHNVTVLTTKKIKSENGLTVDMSGIEIIEVEMSGKLTEFIKSYLKIKLEPKQYQKSANLNKTPSSLIKRNLLTIINQFTNKTGIFSCVRIPSSGGFNIIKAYKKIQNRTFDTTISTFSPYSAHLVAFFYKLHNPSSFWVADYRDLWTQNHISKGLFPFTLIEEYLERKINTTANLITTVSKPLADQLKGKYGISNVEVIENGFDPEHIKNIPTEKIWEDNKVRLVYTGTIYTGKRDPSPLFEAIRQIYDSDYKYLLGNLEVIFIGKNRGNLDELILKYDVSKWVKHLGFLKREHSLKMQRDAHIVLFLEFEAENVDGILTGKLFEYLFSGTQIWGIGVTKKSAPGRLIEESGHGINFGKEVNKIKERLINLLKSGEKPKFKINTKLLGRYTREYQAEKLFELIEKYRKNYINDSEL